MSGHNEIKNIKNKPLLHQESTPTRETTLLHLKEDSFNLFTLKNGILHSFEFR